MVVRRLGVGWASVILGVIATGLVAAGSNIPSLWGDEAASVMSAERPLATLWPVLARVDAVHGVYYVLLHFWIDVFGSTAFSVRFPSALAIGFATAGMVLLAHRLGGLRLGVVAGLVFMIIPRTTYMGAEARSYALSAAVAVWLTLLVVVLIHRGYSLVGFFIL
jgi:mannosyltransferase